MNIWQFASNSPFLAFFLAIIVAGVVKALILHLPNRVLRHKNIRLHGYPPAHCDADGDFKNND